MSRSSNPAVRNIIPHWPVILALLLSGTLSFSYNRLLKSYRDSVDHTFRVMAAIDTTLLRLKDAETGQRGFIITGDEDYLAPFRETRDDIPHALDALAALVSDNTAHAPNIARLKALARAKVQELEDTIAARRAQGFDAARVMIERNEGKDTMDRIRAVTGDMRLTEQKLFDSRVANSKWAERAMIVVAILCVALSLLGRFLAARIARRKRPA